MAEDRLKLWECLGDYPGSLPDEARAMVGSPSHLLGQVSVDRRTMLPPLNEHGDLPAGVHAAGWKEIEQRFGTGSKARLHAFAALKRLHELATATGALRSCYVFGSFVSAAAEPRDVDVVLVMRRDFRLENCPPDSRPLFSHLAAQARFGATIFWFREGTMPGHLLRAWQMKRDGTLRGILEAA